MNRLTKTITLRIDANIYYVLREVVRQCNQVDAARAGATSHGKLTIESALGMLAEDLAMTATRPGSWEGAHMSQVLSSHGYRD
ncbi:hypothetical protein E4L96_20160 [Massilia arenosa]|uniref:Uncharacterized protein n=1 Tax=Zemynaea arenosa TaxID=2561931 RepID=A0A4Y9RWZ3_9BURK|nr:hypothetical protein [Massilia arenosa]TFW13413.1 hypothetical protein E4L96_20160 [Massilia arenosa]